MEKDSGSKGEAAASVRESKNSGPPDDSKPRRRRERAADQPASDDKANDNNEGGNNGGGGTVPMDVSSTGPAKPRRKRVEEPGPDASNVEAAGGGWMNSPEKKPQKLSIEEDDENREAANPNNKEKFFQEGNDDIMVIPDLDEDGYDDNHRVAHAPRNITRKIPTLTELENEVKAAIPTAEGGLDLGVLLRTLVPPQFVQEADSTWTFESLLRDITDEFTAPSHSVVAAGVSPMTPTAKLARPAVPPEADRGKAERASSKKSK